MTARSVPLASNAQEWIAGSPHVTYESLKYASEGTAAHKLADLYLKHWLGRMSQQRFTDEYENLKRYNEHYSQNMEDYVADYVGYVTGQMRLAKGYANDAIVLLEQQLDLTAWAAGSNGRADVIIISGDTIEVIDLKYGRGGEVSAANNGQLRLYGIGAYELVKRERNIQNICMTIVQPRRSHKSTESLNVSELVSWGEIARDKAHAAWNNGAGFSHREIQAVYESVTISDYQLKKPSDMTDDELRDALGKVHAMEKWVNDVKGYATKHMVDFGKEITGWKIVNGRGRRRYADEQKVMDALAERYDIDKVAPRKVLGVTALEEEIGKNAFNELLYQQGLISHQRGKLTIAPDSDYRPEVHSYR